MALNQYVQSGPRTISCTLTFYADSGLAALISKSIPITGDINDAPDPSAKYVFLCINSDTSKQSFLFNEVSVSTNYDPNYNKDKATDISINLQGSNIDPSYDLYTQGTPAELAAILGGRSPI